jgi:hypothetical protein
MGRKLLLEHINVPGINTLMYTGQKAVMLLLKRP